VKRFAMVLLLLVAMGAFPQAKQLEAGFSPGGTALMLVEKAISAAKSEILVVCCEFTSRDVAEALEAAAHRGVKVRIVADWKADSLKDTNGAAADVSLCASRSLELSSVKSHNQTLLDTE
jgi:sugar-specific transcriptional regulator TrmB